MASLKNEPRALADGPQDAKVKLFDYIECFYNQQRLFHSSIGYMSPAEFERGFILSIALPSTTAETSAENEALFCPRSKRCGSGTRPGYPPDLGSPLAVCTSCKSPLHSLERPQTQSHRRNRSQSKPRTTTAD